MSQFKQMLQEAANTFEKDDELENVLIIVTKRANDAGEIEQHVLTNIAAPLAVITAQMQEAMKSIYKEKIARLGAPQES